MIKSNHSLAKKSQKWIVSALLSIMETMPYKKITIIQICTIAQVDRRTFYRNFTSKDDVIDFNIQNLQNNFIQHLNSINIRTINNMAVAQFEFWENHISFLTLLYKNNMLNNLIFNVANIFIPQIYNLYHSQIPDFFEYKCAFITGGFCNILIKWVSTGAKETPEEIGYYVSDLFNEKSSYWFPYK